ncbi:pyocin knob domain-containing protein [Anaerospora hongkongensis]|uniref:pyocin knob domain-containing protein n=1 Tax=Anaerospora hongkongensis TaxID=244830 RepID=UPI0028970A6C|nr:pyocin knob domain-containing protein [Anaerospora hongkongensis]
MADTKTYTSNYNLEKPGQDDFYDVAIFNANADKIDTELKAAATRDTTHKNAATLDHLDNSVTDAKIGNRTINDTVTAAAGANTITNLFSMIGNMLKRITGKSNWWTPPATTLEAANTHITAATGAHAASAISCTATGDVSGTNVQAALTEIAAEKLALANSLASGAVYKYRDLAGYHSTSTTLTGAAKILLPMGWTSTTLILEIEGWNSAGTDKSNWKAIVSGFNNSGGSWQALAATLFPNCPFNSVRFGYDSAAGKCCVLLGTTSTAWDNVKITVKEVLAGNSSPSSYATDWGISVITTETGITNIAIAVIKTLATVEATAPAGYGLGGYGTQVSDANNALLSGWYWVVGYNSGGLNIPPETSNTSALIFVETLNSNNIKQTLFNRNQGTIYTRHCSNGSWLAWRQVAMMDQVAPTGYGIGTAATLAAADWNNYLTTGFYRGADLANAPAATTYYFVMVVRHDDNHVTQHAWSFAGGALGVMNVRTKSSGTWSGWKQIAMTDSPAFTGIATAVTAALGTNTNQIATTAFVQAALAAVNGKVVAFNLGASGGYVAWDFGLILQWGKYTNTSGNVIATVTLPINYTNSYVPFPGARGSNYYTGNSSAYADIVSLSQIKLVLDEDNGGPASDLFWFTIGF